MSVTINTKNGTVEIENDVISTIVGASTTEIFGVVGMTSKHAVKDNFKTLLRQENYAKGVDNKLPPTRILQRSTRGQQEMGDCSPEVLATSSERQRPSIVKTNSMLPKTNK